MLELIIPENEFFNAKQNKFFTTPQCKIILEHSLASVAKWEAKWHIPYLGPQKKTPEQQQDYVRCMLVFPLENDLKVPLENLFTIENQVKIRAYLDDSMTATTFSDTNKKSRTQKIVTSEVLYSRMFTYNIPIECQNWHLNRLITLIRVCEEENTPKQKMGKMAALERAAKLNAERRKKFNSKG
ncbi:MAG: hypothetical protein GX638_11830 [Crenarchaeota archaeon]|nr:hypothetical protein [Thermoproteota archaeon]